jgi:hypothetical protein
LTPFKKKKKLTNFMVHPIYAAPSSPMDKLLKRFVGAQVRSASQKRKHALFVAIAPNSWQVLIRDV